MKSVSPSYGIIPAAASYGTRLVGPLELRAFDAIHVPYPRPTPTHRRLFVIPGWVDTNVFRPVTNKCEEFTVLFSGRALWQKGWDVYVQLARRMRGDGIKFLHVGTAMSDHFIESLGFQVNVEALSQIYSTSHVLMNPARSDSFGRASLESMACGTPVITSVSGPHIKLNLPFVYGTSLEDYTSSILGLRRLWEEGAPYRQLSQRCKDAAQAFSFQSIVDQYERMFTQIADAA